MKNHKHLIKVNLTHRRKILISCTLFFNFCNSPGVFHVEKKSAVQSAIRVGKTMFNKTHDDFFDFSNVQMMLEKTCQIQSYYLIILINVNLFK